MSWHRATGHAAAQGDIIDAVSPAHLLTTVRQASSHRATGRVAAHGEHQGRGYCLSSLRQGVVHRIIVPPVEWLRMENIEAEGTACHHYVRGSYVVASCRRTGHGGSACRTSRQRALPVITTTGGRTS